GIAVSEKNEYSIGDLNACNVNLDGASVGIYKYDPTSEEGKTQLQQSEKTGMYGVQPCLVRGAFIIVTTAIFEQAEKEKISSVFQKF
ncbi:MAG: hypothetical protein LBG76_01495, partial [Treponema sp.]|nr:hypothetical protein [Treponema sp.]